MIMIPKFTPEIVYIPSVMVPTQISYPLECADSPTI